jgi:hypothetical protein
MSERIGQEQWEKFQREGYVHLGKIASQEELRGLQQRIDDIMLGKARIDYDRLLMQLDRESGPESKPGPQTKGFKGATLAYRKIQDLEFDPLFLAYLQKPIFRQICARVHGPDTPVACFRAMFMNKPAGYGTYLVWHQDHWTALDRDPQITVWTALDPARIDNGCVHVIPGSHRALINPEHGSGFLTQEQVEGLLKEHRPVPLELEEGEVVLLHNWLLHSSGVNQTGTPRRAFSVCYMDAATRSSNGQKFSLIFGRGALRPEAL